VWRRKAQQSGESFPILQGAASISATAASTSMTPDPDEGPRQGQTQPGRYKGFEGCIYQKVLGSAGQAVEPIDGPGRHEIQWVQTPQQLRVGVCCPRVNVRCP
jgi:hypothetical protein